MSECCKTSCNQPAAVPSLCKECGHKGHAVQRITPESLLLPGRKPQLLASQYYYCPNASCDVVYFSGDAGAYFYKSDLSVRVGQKETEDPIPVCYCFGYTRESVWAEIDKTGKSAVQADITAKVKAGLCRCEQTNPQGSCCLGNVSKAVKEGIARSVQGSPKTTESIKEPASDNE